MLINLVVKKRVLLGSFGLVETSLQQMREREVWGGGKERERQTDRQTETEKETERQTDRDREAEREGGGCLDGIFLNNKNTTPNVIFL